MRREPATILEGSFSPKLKTYLVYGTAAALVISIIGIPLVPVWLLVGPWWARRHFASLGCTLTERAVVVRAGVIFKREVTIPLDKIQDISLREGPLLRNFGLLNLRIETAGQSTSASGKSEADLVGLIDARAVRDRILAQRDLLEEQGRPTLAEPSTPAIAAPALAHEAEVLAEIRDTLLRIEKNLAAGSPSGE